LTLTGNFNCRCLEEIIVVDQAVAKIYAAASNQMVLNKEFQEHVERIQTEYSFFKG
jgi:hypothetical protein